MRFEKAIIPYLASEQFSNGLLVPFGSEKGPMRTRMDYIETLVNGKTIIHMGCTDHIPLIKDKIAQGQWFHKRLMEKAARCLGVDINREAVQFVQSELGYTDVIVHDAIREAAHPTITAEQWDYMILGEILEHVNDPTLFLHTLQEKYGHCVEKLIITVPNAFDYANFLHAFRHTELINSDHRFWFTPYTLAKVAVEAGLKVDSFDFCLPGALGKRQFAKRYFLQRYPAFRETLVMTLHFR